MSTPTSPCPGSWSYSDIHFPTVLSPFRTSSSMSTPTPPCLKSWMSCSRLRTWRRPLPRHPSLRELCARVSCARVSCGASDACKSVGSLLSRARSALKPGCRSSSCSQTGGASLVENPLRVGAGLLRNPLVSRARGNAAHDFLFGDDSHACRLTSFGQVSCCFGRVRGQHAQRKVGTQQVFS
ncbi:hypothetical protein DUNSADRAFT_2184 [Dunaliella salina]|uniref:Encoded protein n=1 Tax=Dunaliella salina TaxID=3046 RepID=A0ABQ7GW02_DUNSA|nr:hypothetical protein DUNSADRAFT_2184 [Dunaliella salina]|eukprot:KAF5838799.1 hypothetical protein DUNSADRAFT_2184 [Dunaliella salina]